MENELQSKQYGSNRSELFLVTTISFLLSAMIAGSVVYFWQKSANEQAVNSLEQKIVSLEEQISTMKNTKTAPQATLQPVLSLSPTPGLTANWRVYASKNGYTIRVPPGWYLIEDSVNHNEFKLRNCSPDELCMENVVVIRFSDSLSDNTNNLPLETWVDQQGFKYGYYGEKITPTKSIINIANQTAVKMLDEKYGQYWVYIPIKDKVLMVFSTITTGDNQYLEAHKNDLDQILSTFQATN